MAASELAASSDAEASVVRHSPVDEAKRWASGKGRKVGFAKARATLTKKSANARPTVVCHTSKAPTTSSAMKFGKQLAHEARHSGTLFHLIGPPVPPPVQSVR